MILLGNVSSQGIAFFFSSLKGSFHPYLTKYSTLSPFCVFSHPPFWAVLNSHGPEGTTPGHSFTHLPGPLCTAHPWCLWAFWLPSTECPHVCTCPAPAFPFHALCVHTAHAHGFSHHLQAHDWPLGIFSPICSLQLAGHT